MRKRRIVHRGYQVHYDEEGRMFKEVGNAHLYLSRKTVKEIESRKRRKE